MEQLYEIIFYVLDIFIFHFEASELCGRNR